MLLAIDAGNTFIKAAVFEDTALLERLTFGKHDAEKIIETIFSDYSTISTVICSSVGSDAAMQKLLHSIKGRAEVLEVSHTFSFPYTNLYATPLTLGIDRMVLAAGATLQYPRQNRLIIDAGTCITYDFVTASDIYLGGAISPGLRLRYEALHNFTAKLPLLSLEMPESFTGNSTAQAIHSGVVNGVLYEVEGFIAQYREQYQEVTIILTGGNAEFLAKRLKNTIFANSNFLLESMNYLYLYTIKK